MKIYLNKIKESWVIDRFKREWFEYNYDVSTSKINKSDIIWLIAPWTWKTIPKRYLKKKYPESEHSDFEKLCKEILEEWSKMKNRTPIRLIK